MVLNVRRIDGQVYHRKNVFFVCYSQKVMLRGTTTAPLEIRTSRQVFVCAETSTVALGLVN